ncbi:hypothetical protein D8W71_20895 [Rhodococcus sp. P1Y]|nr:hypothetical protein D8W71_20895 [Rhodococcus sp. P1Y]
MRSVIGTEFASSTSFPVAESDIRRWAMAVHYPEPPPARYWDTSDGHTLTAPPDFNPFAWMTTAGPDPQPGIYDPDKNFKKLGVEGAGLTRQVNGGIEVEYGVPIRAGDVVHSSSNISALTEREGKLGLMLFTTTETIWTNQDGDEVRRTKMTIIRY